MATDVQMSNKKTIVLYLMGEHTLIILPSLSTSTSSMTETDTMSMTVTVTV